MAEDGTIEVAKRTVPVSLCDTREYPGCSGPLYRWTLPTTLDYWPVIRCKNHLKLQYLWEQYQNNEWARINPGGPWYNENLQPLSFWEWLQDHHGDDTSQVDNDFKYWDLILAANGD